MEHDARSMEFVLKSPPPCDRNCFPVVITASSSSIQVAETTKESTLMDKIACALLRGVIPLCVCEENVINVNGESVMREIL